MVSAGVRAQRRPATTGQAGMLGAVGEARSELDPVGLVFVFGELWRAVTSLFLHADAAHVISNSLAGVLVFSAVLSTIGRLRGWLLLAFASIGGNLAVAAVNHSIAYRSVGASTAIFAGVGLLSGRAIGVVSRTRHPHRWRAMFVPLAAGQELWGHRLGRHERGGCERDREDHHAPERLGALGRVYGSSKIGRCVA